VGNWVRGACASASMACWWGPVAVFGTGCIGNTLAPPSVSGKWDCEVPGILNRRDEYSGLPVDIDLKEDEDDVGGFWSICWDCPVENSPGNKLLSAVWMSTCTEKTQNSIHSR